MLSDCDILMIKSPSLPCQALSMSCFMDPGGEIYPCTVFGRRLGNVCDHGYSLGDIWRAENTVRTYRACRGRECPGCWSPCEAYPSIYGSLLRSFGTAAAGHGDRT
jgi:hypothetical protein